MSSRPRVVIANGPNLNLLGTREPDIYGRETLADIEAACRRKGEELGLEVEFFQSNHEGELIDRLQERAPGSRGVILNGAALTHYSVALYDCLKAVAVPFVEVHISNIHAREPWREHSVTGAAARGVITGLGTRGYTLAMEYLSDLD